VVAELSALFVLLLAPAGGDELQGVKRGIMEMADLIVVNKADGDLLPAATRTCSDYAGALRLLRKRPQDPPGFPKAMMVSATEATGLDTVWAEMGALTDWRRAQGHWDRNRAGQARYWFEQEVRQTLLARLETPQARARLDDLARAVEAGTMAPSAAAEAFLSAMDGG
jgi:LAO/AO transport system kinase